MMEDTIRAIKCMENAVLPFTEDSMAEFVTTINHMFTYLNWFDDYPMQEQSRIANCLIRVHLFKTLVSFFVKAVKSYPQILTSEFGDEIEYGYSEFSPENVTEETIPAMVANACSLSLEALINITDRFESVQKACCNDGLVQYLLTDILPILSDIKWEEGTYREELLNRSLDIVYNCCKVPSNSIYYQEAKAVDTLLKIREIGKEYPGEADITALLALGYLLDESNNHKILSCEGTIRVILSHVKRCLASSRHLSFGFHLEEILTGLSHIAVNDENKDLICDEDGISILARALGESHDDKELIACCNSLWLLCFCQKGALLIHENEALKKSLFGLRESKSKDVQLYAGGVLWQLKNTGQKVEASFKESTETKDVNCWDENLTNSIDIAPSQHIMISYQWDNQQLAKRIADFLKDRGFKVWLDIYEISGYIMDDMATGVENASALIICLSRKYKNSPNTRRECDYAFQLKKDLVPLMMEENYSPDGWLGILLGTRLWVDFTNQSLFEEKMKDLCCRLESIGMSREPLISPVRESTLTTTECKTDDNHYHGQHHPLAIIDVPDEGRTNATSVEMSQSNAEMESQIIQWGNHEVAAWLKSTGSVRFVKKSLLKKIDGRHLVMLHKLQKTNPCIYYQTAMPQIGGSDFLDVLTFTHHLESLFNSFPSR